MYCGSGMCPGSTQHTRRSTTCIQSRSQQEIKRSHADVVVVGGHEGRVGGDNAGVFVRVVRQKPRLLHCTLRSTALASCHYYDDQDSHGDSHHASRDGDHQFDPATVTAVGDSGRPPIAAGGAGRVGWG